MKMRWLAAAAVVLVACGAARAQEVLLPPEVKAKVGMPIQVIPLKVDGGTPEWRVDEGLVKLDLSKLIEFEAVADPVPTDPKDKDKDDKLPTSPKLKMKGLVLYAEREGTYQIWAWNAKASKASKLAVCKVIVGTPAPPTPPVPPTPPMPPVPPQPDVSPIPAPGLHILIIEESKDRAKYKPGQLNAIFSKEFRTYALQHAAKDTATAGVWHIDKDDDTSGLPAHFQTGAAFLLKDQSPFPRILVSNPGKGYFVGSVPDNAQALIDLCKKYE